MLLAPNGLYGHIRRNRSVSVLLLAAMPALFVLFGVAQFHIAVWHGLSVTKQQQEAADELAPEVRAALAPMLPGKQPIDATIPPDRLGAAQKEIAELRKSHALDDAQAVAHSPAFHSIGRTIWWQMLLLGALWTAISWRFYRPTLMRVTGARRATRESEPRLYRIAEILVIIAGMPMPDLHVIGGRSLNAFSAGLTPGTAFVAVTRGLLDSLDDAELEAVLAHELTHIKNGDTRLVAIATIFSGILFATAWSVVARLFRPRPTTLLAFLAPTIALGLAIWSVCTVILGGWLAHLSLARARDFMADAGAIELTKNPEALISALRKVEADVRPRQPDAAIEAMMFASSAAGPLATQPSLRQRLAALYIAFPSCETHDAFAEAPADRGIGWRDIVEAADRMPTWVGHPGIVLPAAALCFALTMAVEIKVDPKTFGLLAEWGKAQRTGVHAADLSQRLEEAFDLPMDSLSEDRAKAAAAKARTTSATCFPLEAWDPYDPQARPFTSPATDDASAQHASDRLFYAWRGKVGLKAGARFCTETACTAEQLATYKETLKDYMQAKMDFVREYDRLYGATGLAFAQDYYREGDNPMLLEDLRARVARGQIDPHDFPDEYDAIRLSLEKSLRAFVPCRTHAQWRESAYPPPAVIPRVYRSRQR